MDSTRAVLASLPKVELHRHLEGSLRLTTLIELARQHDLDVPREIDELRRRVQVTLHDPSCRAFLATFTTLRQFYVSPEVICRFTREAIEDAYLDNVRYMELRFTPAALSAARNYPLHEVTRWVVEEVRKTRLELRDMQIALIASINRHESLAIAEQVLRIAVDHKEEIVGIDLAGDEAHDPAEPFAGIFREARCEGLGVVIHAGEWAGPAAVRYAIEELGADRIGHGIRIIEDPDIVALARDRGVSFEVCPTSNALSGAIRRLRNHPLPRMLALGLKVTINTDDPAICNVTLTGELAVAMETLGLTFGEIKVAMLTAAANAFQAPVVRESIVERFQNALRGWPAGISQSSGARQAPLL